MKKIRRLINRRPSDRGETESEGDIKDSPLVKQRRSSHSKLELLARDPIRYGLREIPLLPLRPSLEEDLYQVDVVAVHGLGGDFYRTWTYTKEGGHDDDIFWLSQLLPHDLPGARVFSFGYESGPTFSRSVASIKDSAKQLLQNLLTLSTRGPSRPVIFICHSLGGIVVKQAIVTAYQNEQFSKVLGMIRAIIFMGTPHRGSDIAAALQPLAKITNFWLGISGTSAFTGSMRTDLINVLTRDSAALGDVNESFIPRTEGLLIISCSETQKPLGLQQLVVSKNSALLGILGEDEIPLSANHMSMCRFSSLEDPNYKLVSNALIRAASKVIRSRSHSEPLLNARPSHRSLTDSERKYIVRFDATCRTSIDDRVEGTCLWSLESQQYQEWWHEQNSSVLWLTGEAGCGKTIMTSFLAENLEETKFESESPEQSDIVCWFFCERDVETQKDARSVLRGLLSQILISRKDTIKRIRASFDSAKQEFDPSFETLWKLFKFTIEVVPCKCLYIVIDALDECEQNSMEKLLLKFAYTLKEWRQTGISPIKNLKFIFSGQPKVMTAWKAVAPSLNHHRLRIEERPEGMIKDVIHFIDSKVSQLVAHLICTTSLGERLKQALYPLAENSFLWVSVILSHIKASLEFRDTNLIQMLASIPQSLQEAYTRYLPSVGTHNIPLVKRYVQLLVACKKPLSLRELNLLITVQEDGTGGPMSSADDSIVQNSLERALGPLVRFSEGCVQFAHSTVKDYFIGLHQNPEHHLAASHGTDLGSAHRVLARCCIRYLLLNQFSCDLFNPTTFQPTTSLESPTSATNTEEPEEDSDTFLDMFNIHDVPFLKDEFALHEDFCDRIRNRYEAYDYAACNWAHHYALGEEDVSDDVLRGVNALSDHQSLYFANWYRYMANQSSSKMPSFTEVDAITVAALFCHIRTLRELLLQRHGVTPLTLQSALFWAASKGHVAVVAILLDHDADCNATVHGQTTLGVAVQGGFVDVCAILLKSGKINVNHRTRESRPPLLLAAADNNQDILGLLLAHEDILIDQPDSAGCTPILEASRSGSVECLQALIADGRCDVNKTDLMEQNALIHASISGSFSVVKLLLKNPYIQKDSKDCLGRNAISHAAEHGHLPIVQLLLRAKISVAARDFGGRNTLSWAANSMMAARRNEKGQCVLKVLSDICPESVDVKDHYGWTPLAWAMDRPGHLESVKILMETGQVDVNQRDDTSGRPVLAWAATEGFVEITQYLLRVPKLDKNLADHEGRSALSYAAGSGSLEVVRLLAADENVIIGSSDSKGRTALDWARLNQHDAIVDYLRGQV